MLPFIATFSLAASIATAPTDSIDLRREELMSALRQGGYTILLRHARTNRSFQEEVASVPVDRIAQRNLSDAGVRDARLMGVVLKKFAIPVGQNIASPMFRARETAEYALGKPDTTMALRSFPSTPAQVALVMAAPKAGTNRLLVTHHFVIETHVPGIKLGDIGESEAAVVRHTPTGKLELVGRILLADWEALAGAEASTPPAPDSRITSGLALSGRPANADATADTPVGRLTKRYLHAFNSGDTVQMRTFIETSILSDPNRPTDARVQSYVALFNNHGPITVITIESSQTHEIILGAQSKQGQLRLTVKASTEQDGRISSVSFAAEQRGHR